MKRTIAILIACLFLATMQAQRITRTFNDVSLSDALRQLNEQQDDFTIMFLYNELEDFRITTTVSRKTLPEAIEQMIGFYPIHMIVDKSRPEGKKIFVECTYKTDRHLTGTIVDEHGLPLAYANVAVLHPTDSTLLSGGVSNESGYFAIPIEHDRVLARISYVGYKTVYRLCDKSATGTIRMKPDSYTINGVVVKGERPKVQLQGNALIMNVEGTVTERLGTAEDVLSRVPTISKNGDAFEILGKGVPLIYLNNRKLTDMAELRNIQSDQIRNIEVVQNPGARYDASVQAVIVIHTRRAAGEGLGVELTSWSRKGHGWVNNERINLTYRTGRLELFANLFGAYNKRWNQSGFEQTVYSDTLWTVSNRHQSTANNPYLEGRIGFNFQIDDNNSFGGFYQNNYDYVKTNDEHDDDLLANGTAYDHLHNSSTRRDTNAPKHQANLYYTGKLGQFGVDFNADYTAYKNVSRNEQQELSRNYENRDVNTETQTRGRMLAEKLIVSHPLWKGQISVGEEYTNTRWRSSFENPQGYIANSNNEQHESNIAPFVEVKQQLGRFQVQGGLRYEHVETDYFVGGERRADQCRTYNDLFPSIALSTAIQKVQLSLSYAKRTNRPAYWLLSNDVVYENRLNRQVGNPYLRPVKYHNFNAMAMWKWLYLTTNFIHCVNPFIRIMESTEEDSKVNVATIRNYNHTNWLIVTLGNIVALPHDWLLQADFNGARLCSKKSGITQ